MSASLEWRRKGGLLRRVLMSTWVGCLLLLEIGGLILAAMAYLSLEMAVKFRLILSTVAYLRLEMAVSHFGHDLGCKDVPLSMFSNLCEGFGGGLSQDEWARIIQNL